jgi:hypothetical protein
LTKERKQPRKENPMLEKQMFFIKNEQGTGYTS